MRALISVSDKSGIDKIAAGLVAKGVEIISTGGTYTYLKDKGIKVTDVSSVTGFPECLDGRVKTLHPRIHAGILARRDVDSHMSQLEDLHIDTIDYCIINLYPFKSTILKEGVSVEEAIENIDIGGPSALRAAAKNYKDVVVITDPKDYDLILEELDREGIVSLDTKFYLMEKVFEHTSHYDAMIVDYIKNVRGNYELGDTLTLTYEKVQDMRYGENPHQKAAFYKQIGNKKGSITDAIILNGKELSFNNINDINGALELLKEFKEPTVVCCKHGNPCGVGSCDDIYNAWRKAYEADRMSVFGGIVVSNRTITVAIAEEMGSVFLEVLAAPDYEEEALNVLKLKKNLRVLKIDDIDIMQDARQLDMKKVNGGMIVQTIDSVLYDPADIKVVTKVQPTTEQWQDMEFAMKIVKYVKSNGIALAKNKQSIGIGPGQVNRIWAAKQSMEHAVELIGEGATQGGVLASDAFFPFDDVVEAAHVAGIKAIIQPGGAKKDQLSIDKADEYGIAMVFTGVRHFRH